MENNIVKKTEYHELVRKVNDIQTTDSSDLVKKDYYNTKIEKIEKNVLIRVNTLFLKKLIN